jgi:hypothetical protein
MSDDLVSIDASGRSNRLHRLHDSTSRDEIEIASAARHVVVSIRE